MGRSSRIEDPRVPVPIQATVVGVAEPGFSGVTGGYQTDVWTSLAAIPEAIRSRGGLSLLARLKPGVSIAQAQEQMRVLDRSRIEAFAARDPVWLTVRVDVTSAAAGLRTPLHDQFGRPVFALMLLLAVMLLLACANIGTMLLARGAARRREMAVRVSLGAGRFRIARQVLTESLLLAGAGSVAGFIAAPIVAAFLMRIMAAGARALVAVPPPDVALDSHVLLFAVAVTAACTILFGFIPAVAAYGAVPVRALTQTGGTPSAAQRRTGGALVAAQVALSFMLVAISWLYSAHLRELRDRSLGFDRKRGAAGVARHVGDRLPAGSITPAPEKPARAIRASAGRTLCNRERHDTDLGCRRQPFHHGARLRRAAQRTSPCLTQRHRRELLRDISHADRRRPGL